MAQKSANGGRRSRRTDVDQVTPRDGAKIVGRRQADKDHEVVSLEGGEFHYRRFPCQECPWKKSSPKGAFPAEAYRHSARTAYDMAQTTFACHMAGVGVPTVCAGFLLRGAMHNMSVRIHVMKKLYDPKLVWDGGYELYEDYRAMAVANGVKKNDPSLRDCR